MFETEEKKPDVEKILKEEAAKFENTNSNPSGVGGGANKSGDAKGAGKIGAGFNLPLVPLIERAFPDGLEAAAAAPKKLLFDFITSDMRPEHRTAIKDISKTNGALLKLKAEILRSLLEDYGHLLNVDARLAYLALEAVDDVPMVTSVIRYKKELKKIKSHVEESEGE